MLTSMTGYGRAVQAENDFEITVEVRSVNNRFLDTSIKTPRLLSVYEQEIRELVGSYVKRGRINLWVTLNSSVNDYQNLTLNNEMVETYLRIAKNVSSEYGISDDLSMNQILNLPDVIVSVTEEDSTEELWKLSQEALHTAMQEMVVMRDREGLEIKKDFLKRLSELDNALLQIEKIAASGPELELDKLKERVSKIIDNNNIDEGRLELELAIISDRIDISEECTRFKSHNTVFREMLESENSEGRKLNFLLQEMNREANTMASKAYTTEISHLVVHIKEEIEKIREQVQNIE